MTYLRFSPREYTLLSSHSHVLQVRKNLHKLKLYLVHSLRPLHAALAERIGQLRHFELRLIKEHFQETQQPPGHGLTDEDIHSLTEVCGNLLFNARFARPLRRVLVGQLLNSFPELGRKVNRLTTVQFEDVCGLIKQHIERWA